MTPSGDAADQVVRLTLDGVEFAAKIAGAGAKQLAVMLYAILKDQKKTKGKARLTNMLRSGKELKVFAVKNTDLQRFCTEAKKYGALYCVLRDKKNTDGLTDIMVRAEDAPKINRIFERFNLATVDMASVRSEIERTKAEKTAEVPAAEGTAMEADKEDRFLDELMKPAPSKEEKMPENPTKAETEKSRPSEPTSVPKERAEKGSSDELPRSRPSVKKELAEIRKEQEKNAAEPPRGKQMQQAVHQHKAPPKKKPKKAKVK